MTYQLNVAQKGLESEQRYEREVDAEIPELERQANEARESGDQKSFRELDQLLDRKRKRKLASHSCVEVQKKRTDMKKNAMEKTLLTAMAGARGFSFLVFRLVPLTAALRIITETAFLQMTYLYSGTPYLSAIGAAWTERQIRLYVEHVLLQAVGFSLAAVPLWYCVQFYMEAL